MEHVISDWSTFRRALCMHDREAYDAMMFRARQHAAAASNASRLNPTEALFMAILLEHEKELALLKNRNNGKTASEEVEEDTEKKEREERKEKRKDSVGVKGVESDGVL